MLSTVYVLVDPRKEQEYRYVGKTISRLSKRLNGHILECKKTRKHTHKIHWIRKLLEEGFKPKIIKIETVDREKEYEREIYWIAKFKEEGHNLTNSTDGGEGVDYTPEVRRKISEALSGENHPNFGKRGPGTPMYGKTHSIEVKNKLRDKWMGEKNPKYGKGELTKGEKNPFYGKEHSEEAKIKMSEKMKGRPGYFKGKNLSEETKEKLRQAAKLRTLTQPNPMQGKHHSEEAKSKIREAQKAAWAKKGKVPMSLETRKKLSEAAKERWRIKKLKAA